VKVVGEHFVFEDVLEKAAEANAFVLDYLKPCYDMVEGIVYIHVHVTEHEEEIETGQVKEILWQNGFMLIATLPSTMCRLHS